MVPSPLSDGIADAGAGHACRAEKFISASEKTGDEAGRRPFEQLARRTLLLDEAVAHQHDRSASVIASIWSWVT